MYKELKDQKITIKITVRQRSYLNGLVERGEIKSINQFICNIINENIILN